ncbi:D-hexose-6-phosphate mutarotase [Bifidobacterium tissieri]|uniref:Putative glucose-6-phosphate 1-epimerase n=1 Tax=Bifidobacterium tissieri TaxID=1630162 RepID=A0A261FET6_9BIFI|nr:D-hexose-6-phosphate mutarotase [Bifidobacterium tissieri]OZG57681.1 D-hexose-6-phosphate mutarotase [Bifidobacterium tissieri]
MLMNDCFISRDFVNDDANATISDYGAHVLEWAPNGQPSVLWHPKAVHLSAGTAIRGGIPVIFPWFNSGFVDGHIASKNPKHGFGRISFWHYDKDTSTDAFARYTLDSADGHPDWLATLSGSTERPAAFNATYEVHCGAEFQASLTVTNTGDMPFIYESALHTYFAIGDIEHVQVSGLEGTEFLDTTLDDDPKRVQADEPITFDGNMVDRIYFAGGENRHDVVRILDERLGRMITVGKSGSKNTVVWNPGEDAGNAIGDMEAGEWRSFVCVEAANCRDNATTLNPGESATLSQTIHVE